MSDATTTSATVKALNDLAERTTGAGEPPAPRIEIDPEKFKASLKESTSHQMFKIPEPPNDPEPTTTGVQPVHIDGLLYIGIGALTVLIAALQSDKAALAMSPLHLWGAQTVAETINGGLLALKMFRSTSYADSKP